jgi:hypothetical protein
VSNADYHSSATVSQDNMGTFTSKTANNN